MFPFPPTPGSIRNIVNEGTEWNEVLLPDMSSSMSPVPRTVPIHQFDVGRMTKETHRQGPKARGKARALKQCACPTKDVLILTFSDGVRFVNARGREIV